MQSIHNQNQNKRFSKDQMDQKYLKISQIDSYKCFKSTAMTNMKQI